MYICRYSSESAEMQGRRLADMAFLMGLFSYAHQQYQIVKKEFQADQAWLHHAMALVRNQFISVTIGVTRWKSNTLVVEWKHISKSLTNF